MTLDLPLTFKAWCRDAYGWRQCVHHLSPDEPTNVHEARYLAARWLAIDGTREAVVLPEGMDPTLFSLSIIRAHAVWAAIVLLDRSAAL